MQTISHNTTKPLKKCVKCGQEKPDSFNFFYKDIKTNKLRDYCKQCSSKRGQKRSNLEDVFKKYIVNEKTGCWEYTGTVARGYGLFYHQSTSLSAHRVSYELTKGEIPRGLVLDHLCSNKICINPDHLEAVKQGENARRWFKNMQHCITCTCEREK